MYAREDMRLVRVGAIQTVGSPTSARQSYCDRLRPFMQHLSHQCLNKQHTNNLTLTKCPMTCPHTIKKIHYFLRMGSRLFSPNAYFKILKRLLTVHLLRCRLAESLFYLRFSCHLPTLILILQFGRVFNCSWHMGVFFFFLHNLY